MDRLSVAEYYSKVYILGISDETGFRESTVMALVSTFEDTSSMLNVFVYTGEDTTTDRFTVDIDKGAEVTEQDIYDIIKHNIVLGNLDRHLENAWCDIGVGRPTKDRLEDWVNNSLQFMCDCRIKASIK